VLGSEAVDHQGPVVQLLLDLRNHYAFSVFELEDPQHFLKVRFVLGFEFDHLLSQRG